MKYKRISQFFLVVGLTSFTFIGFSSWRKSSEVQSQTARKPPNIVVLVADDMGFSDIAPFGGEISTPNLSAMAQKGMKLTNFRAGAACSPSRAMLLSGVDNHLNGLGTMAEDLTPRQQGKPGYEGYLNERVTSIAEVLQDGGYNTYMVGKWHLGHDAGHFPSDRGFKDSFILVQGGASHFTQMGTFPSSPVATYIDNGKSVKLPKNFFSANFYTDKLIEFLNKNRADRKPFFIYAAYTSPHDPLQAPQEYINKYMGKYDIGWDKIREQRFQRLKQLGIIPNNLSLPPRDPSVQAWDSLSPEQKKYNAKLMAIYAGMVDNLDGNIGRLIQHLKDIGEYENTIFVFMSDNGAAAHDFAAGHKDFEEWFKKEGIDNSYENIGNANSFVPYGRGWADVSATPFFGFKGRVYEGGIRVPMMFYYPKAVKQGTNTTAFATVMDIKPTLLDYAGVKHPETFKGRQILPMNGRSLRPLLEGKANRIYGENDAVGFELFGDGNRALFMGDWKVIRVNKPYGDNQWRLFNVVQDPRELNDLSKQYPDKFNQMISLYEDYEKRKGVVYSDDDPDKVFDRGL